jgi:hypothetical protein
LMFIHLVTVSLADGDKYVLMSCQKKQYRRQYKSRCWTPRI